MTGLNLHFSSFNMNERGHTMFSLFFFTSMVLALIIPSIDFEQWNTAYSMYLKVWYISGFSLMLFFYYFVHKLREIH